MAKTKEQKVDIIKAFSDKLAKAKSTIFVNFKGLNIKDTEILRRALKKEQVEYFAAKKTLIKKALGEGGFSSVDPKKYQGELAAVFGFEDEVAPAKILKKFAKDHNNVKMVAGIFEGKEIDAVALNNLADLPSKPELLAKMVGSLKSPLAGFVNVLNGNLSGLVRVLSAIKDKKTS